MHNFDYINEKRKMETTKAERQPMKMPLKCLDQLLASWRRRNRVQIIQKERDKKRKQRWRKIGGEVGPGIVTFADASGNVKGSQGGGIGMAGFRSLGTKEEWRVMALWGGAPSSLFYKSKWFGEGGLVLGDGWGNCWSRRGVATVAGLIEEVRKRDVPLAD